MQTILMTLLAAHTFGGVTPPQAPPTVELAKEQLPAEPGLTDDVIKKAVRETIAEDPHPAPAARPEAGVFRAHAAEARMSAAFEQAKVPDCLHDNALKLQPAHIGPVQVVGPYSLPWLVAAIARGKCN